MTVPYDGEYLRDPRRACGAPSPTGNWCEAVEGHDGEHWFGLSERWPRKPATIDAEPRSGAGEGTDKGETFPKAIGGPVAPTLRIGEGGPPPLVIPVRGKAAKAVLDKLDANRAELDRLREAVKRVRELHHHEPTDAGHGMDRCADCLGWWPCPTRQALGEEAS